MNHGEAKRKRISIFTKFSFNLDDQKSVLVRFTGVGFKGGHSVNDYATLYFHSRSRCCAPIIKKCPLYVQKEEKDINKGHVEK